mmetsp:Transcript_80647/g.224441  ORF Transcript_80647/g.224441 Transcript_80647/m.224441 type:complete len:300 (-) Transcript_80647:75-974(-)
MQRIIMVRFKNMWVKRLASPSKRCGKRHTTARPTPHTSFNQCSLSHAARTSSCESTESRCVMVVLIGAFPLALASCSALASVFLGMTAVPALLPLGPPSRKKPMQTTMRTSKPKMPVRNSQTTVAHAQDALWEGLFLEGPMDTGASIGGLSEASTRLVMRAFAGETTGAAAALAAAAALPVLAAVSAVAGMAAVTTLAAPLSPRSDSSCILSGLVLWLVNGCGSLADGRVVLRLTGGGCDVLGDVGSAAGAPMEASSTESTIWTTFNISSLIRTKEVRNLTRSSGIIASGMGLLRLVPG